MATLTLEYDGRNALAKKTIEYILSLGVFKKKEEKAYNPEFVKMVLDADKEAEEGNTITVNTENVWESIL